MKIFTLLALIAISSLSSAGHIGDITIKKIRVYDTFALVQTNETMNTPDCSVSSQYFLMPLDETSGSNRKFAALLSAHAQQKKVNPNCSICDGAQTYIGKITMCTEMSIQ